jgi:hypothetical protein
MRLRPAQDGAHTSGVLTKYIGGWQYWALTGSSAPVTHASHADWTADSRAVGSNEAVSVKVVVLLGNSSIRAIVADRRVPPLREEDGRPTWLTR